MPVTKQAIKKVRQDARKAVFNLKKKKAYKKAVKDFLKKPGETGLKLAFKALDRAAKVNVIHKNTASRIKSRLSKKLGLRGKSASPPKASPKKSKKNKQT